MYGLLEGTLWSIKTNRATTSLVPSWWRLWEALLQVCLQGLSLPHSPGDILSPSSTPLSQGGVTQGCHPRVGGYCLNWLLQLCVQVNATIVWTSFHVCAYCTSYIDNSLEARWSNIGVPSLKGSNFNNTNWQTAMTAALPYSSPTYCTLAICNTIVGWLILPTAICPPPHLKSA